MPQQEAPTDSLSTTVKDLASEGRALEGKARLPAVPIYMVVLSLVVIALGIVTLPLGLIITASSQDSISDISSLVTRQAVDGIYNQIQSTMDQPAQLLKIVLNSNLVQSVVTKDYNNLKNETDYFLFLQTLINSTTSVNGINCVTWPGLFPGADETGPWPNTTFSMSYRSGNTFIRYVMDWSTGPYAYTRRDCISTFDGGNITSSVPNH
ncbi:hypothetical protein HDU76_012974 [Blyttiomyces sp. JEL0837]|nr:hypothetical protein HDU76_012974 [Blyttiomyces sp. JEL0837]